MCSRACAARTASAELCRREGIVESLYYSWTKEFLEAGKKRLSGETARQASSGEVKDLRRERSDLKEALAEQVLENRLLKKRRYYVFSLTGGFAGCRGAILAAMRSPKRGFSSHGPLCYVRAD